jgi:hypothetical protein
MTHTGKPDRHPSSASLRGCYGVHNFGTHGSTDARAGRLTAAGQVLRGRRWLPISTLDGVELTRVAELQAEAAAGPNAVLSPEGKLSAE